MVTGEACQEVAALDAKDGSLGWSTPTAAHDHDDEVPASRVEMVDGIVLAGRDDPFVSRGSGRYVVSAFDVETGELLWAHSYDSWSASEDHVYARSARGLEAIDPRTGDVRWSTQGSDEQLIRFGPIFTEDQVTVVMAPPPGGTSDDSGFAELVGLDADDGTERWRVSLELPAAQPVAASEVIVVDGSDDTSGITGIEASSGDLLWERSDLRPRQVDAVGSHLLVRDDPGWAMLNSETGETIWSIPVTTSRLTAAGGILLAVEMDAGFDTPRFTSRRSSPCPLREKSPSAAS